MCLKCNFEILKTFLDFQLKKSNHNYFQIKDVKFASQIKNIICDFNQQRWMGKTHIPF